MKKFIIAIVAILYLGTSSGATIHLHYCMDKLIGWGLWSKHGDYCSKCGMNKAKKLSKGCCKDEQKHVKLAGDQKLAESVQLFYTSLAASTVPFFELSEVYVPSVIEQKPLAHAPPRNAGLTLYIQHCIFRI